MRALFGHRAHELVFMQLIILLTGTCHPVVSESTLFLLAAVAALCPPVSRRVHSDLFSYIKKRKFRPTIEGTRVSRFGVARRLDSV